jgi:hypothetical protein
MARSPKKKNVAAKKTTTAKKKNIVKKKSAPKKKNTPKDNGVNANRLVIHTDDITKILGIHMRSAQRLMQRMKEVLGRRKDEYVSIKEFAKYVHLDEKDIRQNLS